MKQRKRVGVRYVRMDLTVSEADMIDQLRETLLINNNTQVFRTALRMLYATTFKPYLQKSDKTVKTADTKGIVTGKMKDGANICKRLNGVEEKDEDGDIMCKYNTYQKAGHNVFVGENSIALEDLTAEHLDRQFKGGTRDDILLALKEQKNAERKGLTDIGVEQSD